MPYPTISSITDPKFGTIKVGVPFQYGSRVVQITGYDSKTDLMDIQCLESADQEEVWKVKQIKRLGK